MGITYSWTKAFSYASFLWEPEEWLDSFLISEQRNGIFQELQLAGQTFGPCSCYTVSSLHFHSESKTLKSSSSEKRWYFRLTADYIGKDVLIGNSIMWIAYRSLKFWGFCYHEINLCELVDIQTTTTICSLNYVKILSVGTPLAVPKKL